MRSTSSGRGGRYSKRLDRWVHVRICRCGHATPITTDAFARDGLARHVCEPAPRSPIRPVVDLVAVERVITGSHCPLNRGERREVVRRLTIAGESARAIADRLGVTVRSAQRLRRFVKAVA